MTEKFLLLCKENYFEKITPSNISSYSKNKYIELVSLAKQFFRENKYEEFSSFFNEGQYFIALWTAHLLLEHGDPPKKFISQALQTIVKYSDNPLDLEVAKEEREWLKKEL